MKECMYMILFFPLLCTQKLLHVLQLEEYLVYPWRISASCMYTLVVWSSPKIVTSCHSSLSAARTMEVSESYSAAKCYKVILNGRNVELPLLGSKQVFSILLISGGFEL